MLRLSVPILLAVSSSILAADAKPPAVTARAWAIADGKTGTFLWGSNEDTPAKAASTTKIMCAYVVLKLAESEPKILEEKVTFSKFADDTAGSTSGIKAGESLTVAECLYGLLLPSGNDAGNALAEHFNKRFDVPKEKTAVTPRSNFVAEMNRTAKKLDMPHTTYTIPYGDSGSAKIMTTTPRELLHLAHTAMQLESFRKYVSTAKHSTTVTDSDGKARKVSWTNTNQLLGTPGYDGVKTGTTVTAGACLVSSAHKGDDHLLCVVLGSKTESGRYTDTKALLAWAWKQREKK